MIYPFLLLVVFTYAEWQSVGSCESLLEIDLNKIEQLPAFEKYAVLKVETAPFYSELCTSCRLIFK